MSEQIQIHPHEYAFIGSLIYSHALHLWRVRGLVRPEDLESMLAAICYEVILDISARDELVDASSVLQGVVQLPGWEANGNVGSFILESKRRTPDIHNTVSYGRLILENAISLEIHSASFALNCLKQGDTTVEGMVREVNEVFSDIIDVAVRYQKLQKLEGMGEAA